MSWLRTPTTRFQLLKTVFGFVAATRIVSVCH